MRAVVCAIQSQRELINSNVHLKIFRLLNFEILNCDYRIRAMENEEEGGGGYFNSIC